MTMTPIEFAKKINEYLPQVCASDGKVQSHPGLDAEIWAYDPEGDISYYIDSIDIDQLFGCGCWSGIRLILRNRD